MSLIQQYSRNSHHAITTPGVTFSIPPGPDFTVIGGSVSWNVTGVELCDREIGVNIPDKKAYLRIDNEIHEFSFVGSTSSGNDIEQTLAVGNDTGVQNMSMGSGTFLYTSNGGGQLELDNLTIANRVLLSNDNGGYGDKYILMDGAGGGLSITSVGQDLDITNGDNGVFIKQLNGTVSVGSPTTAPAVFINTKSSSIGPGATNSVILGGKDCVIGDRDTVAVSKLAIFGDATGYLWKHNIVTASQSTATTSTAGSISLNNDETITVKCIVNAYCSSPNRNYSATLMGSFLKYGGTVYQTGTTDIVSKDAFIDGTGATLDTDASVVRIRITNGSTLVTRWVVAYEYLISGV